MIRKVLNRLLAPFGLVITKIRIVKSLPFTLGD
jgi:hypothetical protein